MVIEAARILALMPRPRRFVRFALWSGEEQGLIGSLAYVDQHLARRLVPAGSALAPYFLRENAWPIQPLTGWSQLKAYFNMDNGSGKLRGIYAEGKAAAVPMLGEWLAPFAAMGAGAVVADRTDSTDHVGFQSVSVPAYQFVQDPLDYQTRAHHSSADTFDRLNPEDLRQAAVVMADVLWQAANSEREIPRPPLPTKPTVTDPFKYEDPDQAVRR